MPLPPLRPATIVDHLEIDRTVVATGEPAIWAIDYFLYLPYTITYVVYDLLPPVFPGIVPYRWRLELILPVAIVLLVLAPVRWVLVALLVVGLAQLGLLLALGGIEFAHLPVRFATKPSVDPIGRGVGGTALLFVCASLPLYLGAEVREGVLGEARVGAVAKARRGLETQDADAVVVVAAPRIERRQDDAGALRGGAVGEPKLEIEL